MLIILRGILKTVQIYCFIIICIWIKSIEWIEKEHMATFVGTVEGDAYLDYAWKSSCRLEYEQ